jgi:hypothetical protein
VGEGYSTRNLTHVEDKFAAIAGLADMFSSLGSGEYVAGGWRKDLTRGLLWGPANRIGASRGGGRLYFEDQQYCALTILLETRGPSWSWPAVDGPSSVFRLTGRAEY